MKFKHRTAAYSRRPFWAWGTPFAWMCVGCAAYTLGWILGVWVTR